MTWMESNVRRLAEVADRKDRERSDAPNTEAVQLIKIGRAFGLTDEKLESFRQWCDLRDFLLQKVGG